MKGKLRNENFILEEVSEEERLHNSTMSNKSLIEEDRGTDEIEDDGVPFTKKMRIATRQVHNMSDTLVNAKLGLAMSDDKIWAEGLLIFYEIFRFLEKSMENLSSRNEHFRRMHSVISDIERTTAFEIDLEFYYGKDFLKSYPIRQSVADYLRHLQTLEQREPLRLLAYVYHLYMGLLSGGQILKRKRELGNRMKVRVSSLFSSLGFGINQNNNSQSINGTSSSGIKPGNAATSFTPDGRSITDIKKEIAFTMNDIAADLSKDERDSLIEESLEVFRRNNEIVGSIKKTGITALKNYALLLFVFVSIGAACFFYFQQ